MYKCINVLKHCIRECFNTSQKRLDNVAITGDVVIQPFYFFEQGTTIPSIFTKSYPQGCLSESQKTSAKGVALWITF